MIVVASDIRSRPPIRLGFVPLTDCAPIAVAKETGIFDRYGLNVMPSRELGWASIRDKIYYGNLDSAQAIGGIAFSLGLGFNQLKCEVAVPLILNLHGNAITLSNKIPSSAIGRGEGLRNFLTHSWKKERPLTLAATHRFSSHHILLHHWLRKHGLSSPQDAEIIFLPPPLMPRHLMAGHIDGYCVGDPWNSMSILAGNGWCPATSADLSFGHPEKVLLVSGRFLREREEDTIAMTAALLDACRLCQDLSFREDLIDILAMEQYTGAPRDVLENSFIGRFPPAMESNDENTFHVFHGESVNRPTVEKASWVLSGLRNIGALPEVPRGALARIYREDLFDAALQRGIRA